MRGKHWPHTFCPHPLSTYDQKGCQNEVYCGEWEGISALWGTGVSRLCLEIGMGREILLQCWTDIIFILHIKILCKKVKWLVWGLPAQISRACLKPFTQPRASRSHSPARAGRRKKTGSWESPRGELREAYTRTGAKKILQADPCTPHSHLVTFPGRISETLELSIILYLKFH